MIQCSGYPRPGLRAYANLCGGISFRLPVLLSHCHFVYRPVTVDRTLKVVCLSLIINYAYVAYLIIYYYCNLKVTTVFRLTVVFRRLNDYVIIMTNFVQILEELLGV